MVALLYIKGKYIQSARHNIQVNITVDTLQDGDTSGDTRTNGILSMSYVFIALMQPFDTRIKSGLRKAHQILDVSDITVRSVVL